MLTNYLKFLALTVVGVAVTFTVSQRTSVETSDKFFMECSPQDETTRDPDSNGAGQDVLSGTDTCSANKDRDSFFVIAAIFNPASDPRRYELYHNFAQHMKETGAQLVTIECIFPTLNQSEFQVTQSNHPFHIQLKSHSVYWMTENLVNIAVSRLPSHAKWVAWMDPDMSFHQTDWIDLTLQALDKYSVVQLFQILEFLRHNEELLGNHTSFAYNEHHDHHRPLGGVKRKRPGLSGGGWAMSITAFRLINGLPEFAIMGEGDRRFVGALTYNISRPKITHIIPHLNRGYLKSISAYSKATFQKLSALPKPIFGYVPLTLRHHWHGSRRSRNYFLRLLILRDQDYNFERDARKNTDGLLVLNNTSLQNAIISLFQKIKRMGSKTNEIESSLVL